MATKWHCLKDSYVSLEKGHQWWRHYWINYTLLDKLFGQTGDVWVYFFRKLITRKLLIARQRKKISACFNLIKEHLIFFFWIFAFNFNYLKIKNTINFSVISSSYRWSLWYRLLVQSLTTDIAGKMIRLFGTRLVGPRFFTLHALDPVNFFFFCPTFFYKKDKTILAAWLR